MIWSEPFVADVGVGQFDLVVSHGVVKENLDLHFGVVDHCIRALLDRDPQHQIGFRIRVGRFRCSHFANTERRSARNSFRGGANTRGIKRAGRLSRIQR